MKTNRADAKGAGEKFYFTGRPCNNGHTVKRYTSGGCVSCVDERAREWAKTNRQLVNKIAREWYKLNAVKAKAASAAWAKREENRELIRAQKRRSYKKNKARVKATNERHRARKRGAVGGFSKEDVLKLVFQQHGKCAGCKIFVGEKYTIDHKTPLVRGGSNYPDNIQLLCSSCNSSKNTLTDEEWRVSERYSARLSKVSRP